MSALDDYIQLFQLKISRHAMITRPWNIYKHGRGIGRLDGECTLKLITEKPSFDEITEDYPIYELYLDEKDAKLGRFARFELEPGYSVTFIDLTLDGGKSILLTADPLCVERDNPKGVVAIYRGYDWNIYVALESWFAINIKESEKLDTCISISSEYEKGRFGIYKLRVEKEE